MGEADRPLTPVLVGPTGVGKTAVAEALAARLPLTVISADARQIYRGLDIGTAKPGPELRARVPHLGIDLVGPGERYSAGRFARDAAGWLAEVRAAHRLPLVMGGTGLYIRALVDGLFREPPLDPARREQVRAWAEGLAGTELSRWAGRLDRGFAGGGSQRAARAIEVALLTGRPLSYWQRAARETGVMRPWYIHLTLPRETLQRRIERRVDEMLARGLVEEVRRVLAAGVAPAAPGLDGVGYREVVAHLGGRLPGAQLREAIVIATRQYAKRQRTWFRHQLDQDVRRQTSDVRRDEVWALDATESPDKLADRVLERWNSIADV